MTRKPYFILEIDLGNESMRTPEDVAGALREVANRMDGEPTVATVRHTIRDANGNTVGGYNYTPPTE